MRATVTFLIGALTTLVVAAFAALASQNARTLSLAVPGGSIVGAAGTLVVLAAVVGFALALVIATPGRLAAVGQHRRQTRQLADTQQRLTVLREMYAELHGDYQRLYEEHWHLLHTVAIVPQPSPSAGATPGTGAAAAATAGATAAANGAVPAADQSARPLRRTGPLYPPGHPPQPFELRAPAPSVPRAQPAPESSLQAAWERLWARVQARIRRPASAADAHGTAATAGENDGSSSVA